MVVVRKTNRSCRSSGKHTQLPRPENMLKNVTDAWKGYHSVPLDERSSKLNQFITPFGFFCCLHNHQGNHISGDAYNKRLDMVTTAVPNICRQVDDSPCGNLKI